MSNLTRFFTKGHLVLLAVFCSSASMANCLSQVSNLDLHKEFFKRGLSANDKIGELKAHCEGSSLQITARDEGGNFKTHSFGFPVNGVRSCENALKAIPQGRFLKETYFSYCGGSRCYSVTAKETSGFASKFMDFPAPGNDCQSKCAAWAEKNRANDSDVEISADSAAHK